MLIEESRTMLKISDVKSYLKVAGGNNVFSRELSSSKLIPFVSGFTSSGTP